MFNKKLIKGIVQYPAKLIVMANKSITRLRCDLIKSKIINDLSIDIIDKLSLNEIAHVAKMLLDVFGFAKIQPFKGCCLEDSCQTAVLSKNGENYLIKLSNNQNTLCLNKIAMFSVVGACDYGCTKTFVVSNYEFSNDFVCFAKDLKITLVDRSFLKEALIKAKEFKRIKAKEKFLTKLILKNNR